MLRIRVKLKPSGLFGRRLQGLEGFALRVSEFNSWHSRSSFWAPLQGIKRYESQKSPNASEVGQSPSGSTLSGDNFVKKGSYAQGEILCTGNVSTSTANLNQISLHGLLRGRSTSFSSWIWTPRPRQETVQASDLKDLLSQPLSRTKQHHLPLSPQNKFSVGQVQNPQG